MSCNSVIRLLLVFTATLLSQKLLSADTGFFRCWGIDRQSCKVLFTCTGVEARRKASPVSAEILYRTAKGHGTIVDLAFSW